MRKTKKRDYKKEYRDFHGKPKQIKLRNMRGKARRIMKLKKGDPHEIDHIIPLSRGGTNKKSNLQILTRSQNRKKGTKRR